MRHRKFWNTRNRKRLTEGWNRHTCAEEPKEPREPIDWTESKRKWRAAPKLRS